ncbi:hypothetical protein IKG05_00800 [Candidatus Saccharibacteria bacterium]|nr:hypothetical protein [Candidatus Saccharibacteria bacterium]
MTEKTKAQKKSSGIGKFFLGAAIGAAVGAVASKFIKFSRDDDDEDELELELEAKLADEPKKERKPAVAEKLEPKGEEKKPGPKSEDKKPEPKESLKAKKEDKK